MTAIEWPDFYFARHGETDWNRERRYQGSRDIPLNSTGRRQADACSVAAQYPFIAEADCSILVPQFIARCDGTVTVREHLRMLKESGAVRAQADESAFAGFVRRFIAQGFLEIATCRVPATSSTAMM